jgi:hypothetical protein
MHLEGDAAKWYDMRMAMPNAADLNLDMLLAELQRTFTPLTADKMARDKLARLQQTRSVSAYNSQFRKLVLDIPDLAPADSLDMYQRGLKEEVAVYLAMVSPADLLTAMATAERMDALIWRRKSKRAQPGYRGTGMQPWQQQQEQQPDPMELGAMARNGQQGDQRGDQSTGHLNSWQQQRHYVFPGHCRACGQYGHKAKFCHRADASKALPIKQQERRRENV